MHSSFVKTSFYVFWGVVWFGERLLHSWISLLEGVIGRGDNLLSHDPTVGAATATHRRDPARYGFCGR